MEDFFGAKPYLRIYEAIKDRIFQDDEFRMIGLVCQNTLNTDEFFKIGPMTFRRVLKSLKISRISKFCLVES